LKNFSALSARWAFFEAAVQLVKRIAIVAAATIGKGIRICIKFSYSRAMPGLSLKSG